MFSDVDVVISETEQVKSTSFSILPFLLVEDRVKAERQTDKTGSEIKERSKESD